MPKTPLELTEEPSDQVVFRWRRLTIMVGLVDMHASSGSIMSHLEKMRERLAEEAKRAYEKATGSKVTTTTTKNTTATRNKAQNKEATEVGRPLPRSTTTQYVFDPEMCQHSRLEPRGNKNLLWFTCLKCGSRWERVALEVPVLVPQGRLVPQAPSRSAAPPASAVAASGPVAKLVPAVPVAVDKKTVRFLDANQKRKTEDFQMVGFTALGQKVYERYQELIKEADAPHEAIVQKLMSMAQTQEEVAGVVEVIQSLKDS